MHDVNCSEFKTIICLAYSILKFSNDIILNYMIYNYSIYLFIYLF